MNVFVFISFHLILFGLDLIFCVCMCFRFFFMPPGAIVVVVVAAIAFHLFLCQFQLERTDCVWELYLYLYTYMIKHVTSSSSNEQIQYGLFLHRIPSLILKILFLFSYYLLFFVLLFGIRGMAEVEVVRILELVQSDRELVHRQLSLP